MTQDAFLTWVKSQLETMRAREASILSKLEDLRVRRVSLTHFWRWRGPELQELAVHIGWFEYVRDALEAPGSKATMETLAAYLDNQLMLKARSPDRSTNDGHRAEWLYELTVLADLVEHIKGRAV